MTTLNDIYPTDDVDDVLDTWVRELMGSTFRSEFKNVETLSATRVLLDVDTPIQRHNCNGANRIVKMPTADAINNHPYFIVNSTSSGTYTLTVQDNGGTVTYATLNPGEYVLMLPDGNGGYAVFSPKIETTYKITPTVASNNLTLTVTHADGTTPSATRPLWFLIAGQWRAAVAGLTFTLNAGTAWMNLSSAELQTKEVDLFPYVSWRAASSQVVLLASRVPWAQLYSHFSTTSTNETYAGFNATPGAPASGDAVEVIGRFAATLSATNNWSVPGTYDNDTLVQTPVRNTRILSWTPQHTRTTTGYSNAPTVGRANYQITDRRISIFESHTQNATPGGSGYQRLTMPFTNPISTTQIVYSINNTSAVAFGGYWLGSSQNMNIIKYDGSIEATASQVYTVEGEMVLGL